MNRAISLYRSSIGKKYIMAVTGLIGYGFIVGHMTGNLLMFRGSEKMNAYAEFLRSLGGLLWAFRLTLLIAVVLHIVAAYQLTRMSLQSRPVRYEHWKDVGSNYASRTMRWSGPIILLFIVYHLLDFIFLHFISLRCLHWEFICIMVHGACFNRSELIIQGTIL
jgi:succinate dehydrogenase cytochrome b subunit